MANLGYSIVHTSCGGVELLYQKFLDDMKDTVNDNIKILKIRSWLKFAQMILL